VSFVGVRATNVDICHVHIAARLRSPRTGRITAEEARDITLVAQGDGFAEPDLSDISSVANVPLCPDYGDESVVFEEYSLEVHLEDSRGYAKAGDAMRSVVPSCRQVDTYERARCVCECRARYKLGSCAHPLDALDAGDER